MGVNPHLFAYRAKDGGKNKNMKKIISVGSVLMLSFGVLVSSAPMALAAVGTPVSIGQNSSISNSSSISITVPSGGVATGNTIIISFAMDPQTGTVTASDTKGNTYNKDTDVSNGTGSSGVRTIVFSAPVTTALVSGNTITVSFPTAKSKAISVYYVSGLVSASPTDQTHTGTADSSSPSSGAAATTTQANELLIGVIGSGLL